jgi:superfamily I DNA/RNA helicase
MTLATTHLNEHQLRAVEHPGGPLLVLAGPGTGKTGVLVARIAHLVGRRGVRPERILALTFSRRAADEMSERVKARLPEAALVETRTFHSFALSVVRRHPAPLGLSMSPEIIPTGEQWALVSELLADEDAREWGLAPGALERPATVREVYDLLLRCQEHLLEPQEMRALGEKTKRPYLVRAAGILERYRVRLAALPAVDYEGVVQYALKLLSEGGPIRQRLTTAYDHVLVDEFQDTNRSQLELVRRLMPGDSPNVFCVGDDAQSIYGFRGARVENVREFEEHFPGARTIQLRTNYRSASGIIRLAEDAIAGDESRPPREEQWASSIMRTGTVFYRVLASPREEGEWIADRIVELNRARGVPFEEMVVLRRSLLDTRPLVDALSSRGIPMDVAAAPEGSTTRHLALLLVASNGEEPGPIPAMAALASPLVGLSPSTARALRTTAGAAGRSVFGFVRSGDLPVGLPEGEVERARRAVAAVDEASSREGFLAKLDALWKNLPGVRELFEQHAADAEAARALADAAALLRSARAYARVSKRPSVAGFLRAGKIAHEDSDTWSPAAPPAEGAVRLLTVHASKGLEFDAVFVSGLTEDRFPVRGRGVQLVDPGLLASGQPTPRSELERHHLFEERRLLYVALTRARSYLGLSGVEEGAEDGAKASPFLRELEGRLIELERQQRERRFWVSREEAVEELRRRVFDPALPPERRFAAGRALLEMGERPAGEPPEGWWTCLKRTEGAPPEPAVRLNARSWEVLAHLDCPRQAFMKRFSTGGRSTGRMRFGSAFKEGMRRFLSGEQDSLEEAILGAVGEEDFGGSALDEYWEREARESLASCERWAAELRNALVSEGGSWRLNVGEHEIRGDHGPVIEEGGERVVVRVSTSKYPARYDDAAEDPLLALQALGADAPGARLVYPRKLSRGKPAERPLTTDAGWRDAFAGQVRAALAELAAGEIPARPRSGEICRSCAFRITCPLHAEDEPWLV